MNKTGVLGEVLEGIKEEVKEDLKVVSEQVGVAKKKEISQSSQDEKKDFVKDLYGDAPSISQEEIQRKELEDKQKVEVLSQRLHGEYYQRLVSPPKAKEDRPAEKVEREQQEEKWELEKKEAKKPKLPRSAMIQQGTAELHKAVSG